MTTTLAAVVTRFVNSSTAGCAAVGWASRETITWLFVASGARTTRGVEQQPGSSGGPASGKERGRLSPQEEEKSVGGGGMVAGPVGGRRGEKDDP